jgi:hypothetical protein
MKIHKTPENARFFDTRYDTHPDYYRSSEYPSAQSGQVLEEPAALPQYKDYTHPSHYGVFPSGSNEAQESYTPVDVEWTPGEEERGKTQ